METQLVHDSSQWSSAAFIPAKLVMSRISRIFRDSLSCKVNFIKNEFRSTRICFYLKTSMLFPSVFTKSFSLFTCRYQAISVWKRIIFCPYCWFVAEVTAAMLVDNSWCFSLAWELNFVFFVQIPLKICTVCRTTWPPCHVISTQWKCPLITVQFSLFPKMTASMASWPIPGPLRSCS